MEPVYRPPKGVLRKTTHNSSVRAAQHYSIVEDLTQAPCAMSALEVLQSCPQQCKSLLSTIGGFDLSYSNLIAFNADKVVPHVSHQIDFHIIVHIFHWNIHRTLVDEITSTCVMSVSCWKALGSLALAMSNMNLQDFDRHNFVPKGVLPKFPIELGGKIVYVYVEVVDTSLDYNLLLGYSWFYAMTTIVLYGFHLLCFPREGKIVTIDQLDYCMSSAQISTNRNYVLLMRDQPSQFQSVVVGLFKSSTLMGVFPQLSPPETPSTPTKALMQMISSYTCGPRRPLDPWVVSPDLMEVDQASENPLPPVVEEIASLAVL